MRDGSGLRRSAPDGPEARRRAAEALIATHDAVFRRTARRYSICADDAEDAYQRAVEILLTRARPGDLRHLAAWMQVVTRREALAVRRSRERLLSSPAGDDDEPLERIASERPSPHDLLERRERVADAARLLSRLKPHERLALLLQAHGYSYAEIRELCGWTYTKVNRCLAEGRARLHRLAEASGLRS